MFARLNLLVDICIVPAIKGTMARSGPKNRPINTYLLPKDISRAHDCGEIHYHDLDYAPFFPMFNCMLIGSFSE